MTDCEIQIMPDEIDEVVMNGDDSVSYNKSKKRQESLNNLSLSSTGNLCNESAKNETKPTSKKIHNGSPNGNKKSMISLTHLPKSAPVDIEFSDLSYSVWEGCKRGYKTILNGVNGEFKSGELTAIMGPSGAGKSTLMNILAGYRTKNVTGSVLINKQERNLRTFRKTSCYIMQDDCLTPHLTAIEALTVSANLKLGKNISEAEKKVIITEILETLELQECKDTTSMCLSRGQRKGLSIALELVNNPPVMFFDEPTSGLDSSSCFQCISLLKSLARGGRTVICAIHQPSARLFEMFDHLYMLGEGQCLYRGVVSGLVPYLSIMGLSCPTYHNPADYVMEVACGEHGDNLQKLVVSINAGKWNVAIAESPNVTNDIAKQLTPLKSSSEEVNVNPISSTENDDKKTTINTSATCITSLSDNSSENIPLADKTTFPTGAWELFCILLKRTFYKILKDHTFTQMRIIAHFIIGILLGLIYYDIGDDASKVMNNTGCIFLTVLFTMFSAMMPSILTFPLEMSVFVREHMNYWYSLKAFYFAKTLADIPFQILLSACFMMGLYYLTSQPWDWIRFLMMLLILVQTALVSQSFGLLIGAAFNVKSGVFLGPIFFIPMVLFSGFFAKLNDLSVYLHWLGDVTFVRYSFEGCMIAIYGLNRPKLVCNEDYCEFEKPTTFLSEMSMTGDFRFYINNVIALLGFFIIVRVSTYIVLLLKLRAIANYH